MEKTTKFALIKAVKNRKYERVRQKRWDDEHMKTASCRIIKEVYAMFREVCEYHETTVHRALRSYIAYMLIKWHGRENVPGSIKQADALYLKMVEDLPF